MIHTVVRVNGSVNSAVYGTHSHLGVTQLIGVSVCTQKVMSEVSEIMKSVIRTAIGISAVRKQSKVRSETQKTTIQKNETQKRERTQRSQKWYDEMSEFRK
eukprot:2155471-Amphidinium_carterae.1